MRYTTPITRPSTLMVSILVGLALLGMARAWGAEGPGAEGQRIVAVRVVGNERVSDHRILGQMRLREGSVYTPKAVDEDLKRIYDLRQFDNVVIRPRQVDGGIELVVEVDERPVLEALEFLGNHRFSDEDLAETVGVVRGDLVDRHRVVTGVRALEEMYRDAGHYFVEVELDREALATEQVARYTIAEGPRVKVRHIRFVGNASIDKGELMRKMETKTWFPLFRDGIYDEEQIERDLIALRNFYIEEGFLDVRINRELEFDRERENLTIRIVVDEGPRYEVRSVALKGVDRFSRKLLKKQMETKPGTDYTAGKVREDLELIRETYGEVGYIDMTVRPSTSFAEAPGLVDVVFDVTEREASKIGLVRIQGNTVTKDKVVRQVLQFYPGEPVNTKLIDRARKRLEGLGIFEPQSIEITTVTTEDPDVRDVVVRVAETDTGNLIFGAGVNSNSGFVGNMSFVQRNFDITDWPESMKEFWSGDAFRGGGQLFQIVLEPGDRLQRYRVDFRDPYVFDTNYGLSMSGFFFERERDKYDEQRLGGNVGISKEIREDLRAFVNFRLAAIDITDVDPNVPQDLLDVEGDSELTSVEIGLTKDTTDSRFFPTEGYRLTGSAEQAGALGGSYDFTKFVVDGRRYWTVTEDVLGRKSVLAVRGRLGFIANDAPIFERFYAGGHGSIRGFEFRGVGPKERDTFLGGDFLALASAEYSFPILERNLTGVLFLDTGTVESDIELTTWRASVGAGIRFTVPFFGPVPFAFDFGFPISSDDDDDEQVFSFSVGTTF